MEPLVTVVIPFGAAHRSHVKVALASVFTQTLAPHLWRAIVVDDSGGSPDDNYDHPLFRHRNVLTLTTGGGVKSAAARNLGLRSVATPFVVFLDADDYLLPGGLYRLLSEHLRHELSYTYSSHVELIEGRAEVHHLRPPKYSQAKYGEFNIHTITALVPTGDALAVGGFDEQAPGWEDWTFWLKLAQAGHCGQYAAGPVFVYRADQSVNHPIDLAGGRELMDRVVAPYLSGPTKEFKYMPCGCSADARSARNAIKEAGAVNALDVNDRQQIAANPDRTEWVLEFIGPGQGTQQWVSQRTGKVYRAGNTPLWQELHNVPTIDLDWLLGLRVFRIKAPPVPFVEPPNPDQVAASLSPSSAADSAVVMADEPEPEPVKKPVAKKR